MFIGAKTLEINGVNQGPISTINPVLPAGVELIPFGFVGPWIMELKNGKKYEVNNVDIYTITADTVIKIEEA
jgi:hypothetical protein